ncbi:MAG: PAS domain S-box protein, partial [Actinobacteria bacterium]|nr:PAS domain S-box protein [Actinomycetota bacterium]
MTDVKAHDDDTARHGPLHYVPEGVVIATLLVGLWATSLHSYLLFHSIAEATFVAVSVAVFAMAWHLRRFVDSSFSLIVGIGLLCVVPIQFLHMLAYKGMGVFPGASADLPTQLWIAARALTVVVFLVAAFLAERRVSTKIVWAAFSFAAAVLLASILWWRVFPVCYVEGVGLTPFKVVSEYVIAALFVIAAAMTVRRGSGLSRVKRDLVAAALLVSAASEISFTLYVGVYSFFNLLGHLLMVLSVYLVYRGVVVAGTARTYARIVRDAMESLRDSEERFRTLFEQASDGIFLADETGHYIEVNPAGCDMLGYTRDEILSMTITDPVDPDELAARPIDMDALHSGRVVISERRFVRKDGSVFPAEISTRMLPDGRIQDMLR